MKKKVMTMLAGALILASTVSSAFAALTDDQKADINKIESEIANLRKQVVQKYVDAGEITGEEGKLIQERIDAMEEYRAENGFVPGYGRGKFGGRGGFGCGYGAGGYGPMMGSSTSAQSL